MGYLNNTSVTVDAVLTKKGREKLAKGSGNFVITKFALADDEIDYSLWNPLHPSGSDYYGTVIESMPILEAFIDESQAMRYKLISIESILSTATQVNLPYIELISSDRVGTITAGSTISVNLSDSQYVFSLDPITNYMLNGQIVSANLDSIKSGFGYTYVINKDALTIINDSKGIFTDTSQFVGVDASSITATTQAFSGDGDFTAITRVGSGLQLTVNSAGMVQTGVSLPFLLPISVIGNQTGTTFNFIISFDIPNNLKNIMGTSFSKGQVIKARLPQETDVNFGNETNRIRQSRIDITPQITPYGGNRSPNLGSGRNLNMPTDNDFSGGNGGGGKFGIEP